MKPLKLNSSSLCQLGASLLKTLRAQVATKKFWFDLVVMTAGMFVASCSVYFFLIPSHLIVGSITGLSLVIAKFVPFLSVGTMIFIINAILLLLAFVLIGNEFGAKTVYTALILGPMIDFLGAVCPIKESLFAVTIQGTGQVIANPWFDLLCFVLVLSVSQSILFSINASTGGLDILAKIINKYCHVSLGTSVTIGGGAICCSAFLINDVSLVIMGLVGTWINGLVVDYFTASLNKRKRVCVISNEYDRIRRFIIDQLGRGCSLYEVIGGYTGEKSIEIQSLLTQEEFSNLMEFLKREGIKSFVTAGNVSEVYGLWLKHKKFHF